MSEWQPIETAPKDGTPIIVLCKHKLDRRLHPPPGAMNVAVAWWGKPDDHSYGGQPNAWCATETIVDVFSGSELTGSWEEVEFMGVDPTHWMSLPEPPK